LKVVIIDDDPPLRRALRRALEAHGIEVEDFADGPLALERIRAGPVGCAIVDLQMPGWDGVRTAEALRAVQPDLPLIVWTGGASPALVARARALGLLAFFDKPCDVQEMLGKLRTIGRL
jgi:DNA-binding NtrC family response regulator